MRYGTAQQGMAGGGVDCIFFSSFFFSMVDASKGPKEKVSDEGVWVKEKQKKSAERRWWGGLEGGGMKGQLEGVTLGDTPSGNSGEPSFKYLYAL